MIPVVECNAGEGGGSAMSKEHKHTILDIVHKVQQYLKITYKHKIDTSKKLSFTTETLNYPQATS